MGMLERAWKLVKTTNVNSWKKGGFIPGEDAAQSTSKFTRTFTTQMSLGNEMLSITVQKWPTKLSPKKSFKTLFSQSPKANTDFPYAKKDDEHAVEVEEAVILKDVRKSLEILKSGYFLQLCSTSK